MVARFGELMAAPRPPLDLALALVAAAGRPQVRPEAVTTDLDDLADRIEPGGPAALCRQLFDPEGTIGLRGDRTDYFDPANSLLDRVLARRRGIPITLSVIAIEVARRHGLELEGIGMPGHFLVGDRTTGTFFDAFDGGRPVGPDGARAIFVELHGPDQPFEPVYLAATPAPMIVVRVLNNLRGAHLRRGDRRGLATTLRLQAALPGASMSARRDLAGVLAADGRFLEAADEHDRLARDDPDGAAGHRAAAARLRARLN